MQAFTEILKMSGGIIIYTELQWVMKGGVVLTALGVVWIMKGVFGG